MSFGEDLKRIRNSRGMSQKQLSEAAKIKHYQQIGQYEADARKPKRETVEKIAKALGCAFGYDKDGEPYFYEFRDVPQELFPEDRERQHAQLEAVKQWRSAKEQKEQLNKNFDAVNATGKQKIVDYSEDIKDKYKK